jgi:hypothetical protein
MRLVCTEAVAALRQWDGPDCEPKHRRQRSALEPQRVVGGMGPVTTYYAMLQEEGEAQSW